MHTHTFKPGFAEKGCLTPRPASTAVSPHVPHHSLCSGQIPLRAHLGDIGIGVPEDDLGGLQSVFASDLGGGRVAQLVRRPAVIRWPLFQFPVLFGSEPILPFLAGFSLAAAQWFWWRECEGARTMYGLAIAAFGYGVRLSTRTEQFPSPARKIRGIRIC